MKIKFTCPKCGGHVLNLRVTHEESESQEIIGTDNDGYPIFSEVESDHWEGNHKNEYSCGECMAPFAGGEDPEDMIKVGISEGWIEKVEE